MDDLLTTRQLQDLLQVDRITIYRMLRDGRLRGFKVGGQWRFPRREIETWLQEQQARLATTQSPALQGDQPTPSPHVLPLNCVQAIQSIYAEALDIAAVTTDRDGSPLTEVSNSCDFCTLILSTERGRHRCIASWRQANEGQAQPCHAGLLCAGAPVWVGGQWVAIAVSCQFVVRMPEGADRGWQTRLPTLAADLGLSLTELQAAAGGVRSLPASHLLRAARLLQRTADTFSEIGQERLALLGRLRRIAEITELGDQSQKGREEK